MNNVLASIQSRLDPIERVHSRTVSLREMMRRATSVARVVTGTIESREPERDDSSSGMAIPTLSWPPDPPAYDSLRSAAEGERPTLSRQNSGASTSGGGAYMLQAYRRLDIR